MFEKQLEYCKDLIHYNTQIANVPVNDLELNLSTDSNSIYE